MKNIIQSKYTAAEIAEINDLISQLKAKFKGKTGVLTAEERKRYGSVNEQNKLIINKARDFRQNSPDLSAPNVDWDEFETDYQARIFTEKWANDLDSMSYDLKGTKIMHDYDNLQDSLTDYGFSQFQHGAGEEGYSNKVEEYRQFFTKADKNTPPAGEGEPSEGGNNS